MELIKVEKEDDFYIGKYLNKVITKQKSLEKCLIKLAKYVKGLK